MVRDLNGDRDSDFSGDAFEIRQVIDGDEFRDTAHPAIGPLTTTLRKHAFQRLCVLVREPAARTRMFVAWHDDKPVGSIEVFYGTSAAGIHSLHVPPQHQRRGVGTALIERACVDAKENGARMMVLLASAEGHRIYARRGFMVVGHLGYWYRSFQRG